MYETVFEITQKGYPWWLYGGLLLFVAFVFWVGWRNRESQTGKVALQASVFGLVLLLAAFGMSYSDRQSLLRAYQEGQYILVEGPVENFHPESEGGSRPERFRLGGVNFSYSTFEYTPGFNHTLPRGGPIREGLLVRIAHRNRIILRLETWRDTPPFER